MVGWGMGLYLCLGKSVGMMKMLNRQVAKSAKEDRCGKLMGDGFFCDPLRLCAIAREK